MIPPSTLLRGLAALALALSLPGLAQAEDNFLAPEQAFNAQVRVADAHTLQLQVDIAPGYHLYRERLHLAAVPQTVALGTPTLPAGRVVHDDNLGRDVEIYEGQLRVNVPVPQVPSADFQLQVDSQGCADAGLCYPPQQQHWRVSSQGGVLQQVRLDDGPPTPLSAAPVTAPVTATNTASPGLMASTLQAGRLWQIASLFLLAGLLLSFTPCVLPMVPILSSIIVGQQQPVSKARGLSLSVAYALGMALVYTAFGVAAGLAGEGLAARLQQPAVLGAFASLLMLLSLSMFGLYQLQLPNAWQSRLTAASGHMQGGRYTGVFLMGGLSALIVGPCVAAPLAGALVFISQTGDVLIGGLALFCLACGMSVPLLLVGLSAGSLLPRAGAWMEQVKQVFGVMLLGVAWWMVSPVLPAAADLAIAGAALLCAAVWLWSPASPGQPRSGWQRSRVAASLLLGLAGSAEVLGALAGSADARAPLAVLAHRGGTEATAMANAALTFRRIRSVAELDAALRNAPGPTVLDVYADWCVACKENTSPSPTRLCRRGWTSSNACKWT